LAVIGQRKRNIVRGTGQSFGKSGSSSGKYISGNPRTRAWFN
jgi:hypothetical protein